MASENGSGCLTIILIILILYTCETSGRVDRLEEKEKIQHILEDTRSVEQYKIQPLDKNL